MSDLLSIGASGVRAYQSALNVIGENISNASTTGYVRRDATLREVAGTSGGVLQINAPIGHGVIATGVTRSWDQFRAAEVRTATAESQRSQAGIVWLQQIESSLTNGGLAGAMTAYFNAAQGIAADPTGIAPRQTMIDAGSALVGAFNRTASSLAATADDLEATARNSVDQLNGLLGSLATANAGIGRAAPGSNAQAQLFDQRDRLLDQISALVSINVTTDARGAATVSLNQPGGPVLVDNVQARTVSMASNSDGTIAYTLNQSGGPQAIAPKGGTLAGLADAALRVADARQTIDAIATDFADRTGQVQLGGVDLDGNDGTALFVTTGGAAGLAMTTDNPRAIAAAARWATSGAAGNGGNAAISITGGPASGAYTVTVAGGTLTLTDPVTGTAIASAAYTPGTAVALGGMSVTVTGTPADGDSFAVARNPANSRDNANLANLAALRASAGFETAIAGLTSANASALASRKAVAAAQGAILDGAVAARDSVSGVNLDNEAVELMRFQQAYAASSRIIQVARDTFQTILDIR
ncbi:flagellar hook-associated protein FlgK [Sphingomonas flavalba]|uniref:flagellar hook-associated protein FlgK n=1 Tax=Sphingomonas flavalba TaxID=2559804 RepID=UPI0039E064FE